MKPETYRYAVADEKADETLFFTDEHCKLDEIAKRNKVCTCDVMFRSIQYFCKLPLDTQDKVMQLENV